MQPQNDEFSHCETVLSRDKRVKQLSFVIYAEHTVEIPRKIPDTCSWGNGNFPDNVGLTPEESFYDINDDL